MEPKTKQSLLVTVVGVTLFVALLRLSDVLAFAAKLIDLVLPILAGGILALFINVPMTGLEKRLNRLFGKAKKQPSAKAIHLLSFFITLLGVVLVLVLALTLLIPELVQSFHSLYVQIEANIPRWTAYLNAQDADMGWLMNWLEGINWEQLLHKVTASIDTVLVNAVGAVSATVNIAITASFALIISVYMSLSTESLGHQARTLVCAYLKPAHAAGVLKFCRLFRQSFANFLTGQCSEAVILGVLMALAFSVFKIPYGSLVGVLTAICAIIPYVGALISCVVPDAGSIANLLNQYFCTYTGPVEVSELHMVTDQWPHGSASTDANVQYMGRIDKESDDAILSGDTDLSGAVTTDGQAAGTGQ